VPIFREVWSFQGTPAGTWSEVYYSEVGTLAIAANFAEDFYIRRLNMLHPVNTWTKIRVSDIANPRATALVNVNRKGLSTVGALEKPANGDEAAVIRLTSTVVPARRQLWLRGLAESDVARDSSTGVGIASPEFLAKLNAFIAGLALTSNNYVILSRKHVGEVGVIKGMITSVDGQTTPGRTIITTDVPTGVVAQSRVIIARTSKKDFPALNGIHTVTAVAGNTFTIPYRTPQDIKVMEITGAYAFKLEYKTGASINAAASGFAYMGSRRSKNVFTGSRGARRAARLREQV
jgi:hypothetical protein